MVEIYPPQLYEAVLERPCAHTDVKYRPKYRCLLDLEDNGLILGCAANRADEYIKGSSSSELMR